MTAWHSALALACAALPFGAQAQGTPPHDAGAYLAARAADGVSDFEGAAAFFARALDRDPGNAVLFERTLVALLADGLLDRALGVIDTFGDGASDSQIARIALLAGDARDGDWDGLIARLDAGDGVADIVDELSRAWALIGQGDTDAGIDVLNTLGQERGYRGFALYHKAMALASTGDWTAAEEILSAPPEAGLPRTRRSIVAHLRILSQLGRNDDAVAMLDDTFGPDPDPAIRDLRARLADDETVPFTTVNDPAEGIAEVFYSVGGTLMEQSVDDYVLIYARTAQLLHPDDAEMTLMVGGLLEALDRYDLAAETFATVAPDDPAFHAAELGRADALRRSGQPELAVEVLQNMLRRFPDLAMVHIELGDQLRRLDRLEEANVAYTDALSALPQDDPRRWLALYQRAITFHGLDDWPRAEADFRAALALQPDQPAVLNYLGYSMVERRENLDEALGMIERAVAAQPDSGAIVDSLGWALYTLGRAEEAVAPMERAAALLPEDAVVNDHLGDVYWTVGRRLEARFQWRRALSFDPEPDLAEEIRAKIETGLPAPDADAREDVATDL